MLLDMETNNTPGAVTDTIIAQLGGSRIFAMAFSSVTYGTDDGRVVAVFKVARGLKAAHRATHVRITLDPSDTYTVETIRVTRSALDTNMIRTSVEGVYCDMLRGIVEKNTGLYLSL